MKNSGVAQQLATAPSNLAAILSGLGKAGKAPKGSGIGALLAQLKGQQKPGKFTGDFAKMRGKRTLGQQVTQKPIVLGRLTRRQTQAGKGNPSPQAGEATWLSPAGIVAGSNLPIAITATEQATAEISAKAESPTGSSIPVSPFSSNKAKSDNTGPGILRSATAVRQTVKAITGNVPKAQSVPKGTGISGIHLNGAKAESVGTRVIQDKIPGAKVSVAAQQSPTQKAGGRSFSSQVKAQVPLDQKAGPYQGKVGSRVIPAVTKVASESNKTTTPGKAAISQNGVPATARRVSTAAKQTESSIRTIPKEANGTSVTGNSAKITARNDSGEVESLVTANSAGSKIRTKPPGTQEGSEAAKITTEKGGGEAVKVNRPAGTQVGSEAAKITTEKGGGEAVKVNRPAGTQVGSEAAKITTEKGGGEVVKVNRKAGISSTVSAKGSSPAAGSSEANLPKDSAIGTDFGQKRSGNLKAVEPAANTVVKPQPTKEGAALPQGDATISSKVRSAATNIRQYPGLADKTTAVDAAVGSKKVDQGDIAGKSSVQLSTGAPANRVRNVQNAVNWMKNANVSEVKNGKVIMTEPVKPQTSPAIKSSGRPDQPVIRANSMGMELNKTVPMGSPVQTDLKARIGTVRRATRLHADAISEGRLASNVLKRVAKTAGADTSKAGLSQVKSTRQAIRPAKQIQINEQAETSGAKVSRTVDLPLPKEPVGSVLNAKVPIEVAMTGERVSGNGVTTNIPGKQEQVKTAPAKDARPVVKSKTGKHHVSRSAAKITNAGSEAASIRRSNPQAEQHSAVNKEPVNALTGKSSVPTDSSLKGEDPGALAKSAGMVKSGNSAEAATGQPLMAEVPAMSAPANKAAPVMPPSLPAQLARETSNQFQSMIRSGQTSGEFSFQGGTLGTVRVTFTESNLGTALQITVETTEVQHALQKSLPTVEQELNLQGLQFAEVRVAVGNSGEQKGFSSAGAPAEETAVPEEAADQAAENNEEGARDYGYNTVEFVA